MKQLMKPFVICALSTSILVSCAHDLGLKTEQAADHGPYSAVDWESGDNHVAYVDTNSLRAPSSVTPGQYKITGACGGFPKVDVKTAPGFCVGLVYDGAGLFKKLRWVAPISNNKAVVTEMGGWANFNGKIMMLNFAKGKSTLTPLLTKASFPKNDPRRGIINEPNQVSVGPDGLYWVGGATGIYRFDPLASDPASTVDVVIDGLPGAGLHPLKSFTVDDQNNLYINIGAGSNVCQNFTKFADKDPQRNPKNFRALQFSSCPEVEDPAIGQGLIRRYKINADHSVSPQFEIFAKGLRNSISLAWDAQHHLLLNGENGRDAINKLNANLLNADLPHERINVLSAGQNYGWPYCYDDGKNNPEWPNIDCSVFTKPTLLIPAHTAPLGMIVYQGTQFPKWYRGRPLLALHGYEPRGHRIVTFMQDEAGRPTGVPRSLVYDWEKRGLQEKGKPVGIAELPDGSVLIVEDEPQNKILRLFYDPRAGNGVPVQEIDRAVAVNPATAVDQLGLKAALAQKLAAPNPEPFVLFQHKVIDKICAECHQADGAPGVQLIPFDFAGNAKRIIAAGRTHDLITVIKGQGPLPSMPPQGWDQPDDQKEALDLLQKWIATLQ